MHTHWRTALSSIVSANWMLTFLLMTMHCILFVCQSEAPMLTPDSSHVYMEIIPALDSTAHCSTFFNSFHKKKQRWGLLNQIFKQFSLEVHCFPLLMPQSDQIVSLTGLKSVFNAHSAVLYTDHARGASREKEVCLAVSTDSLCVTSTFLRATERPLLSEKGKRDSIIWASQGPRKIE